MAGRQATLRAIRARYATATTEQHLAVTALCDLLLHLMTGGTLPDPAEALQWAIRRVRLACRSRTDLQVLLALAGAKLYKLGIGRFGTCTNP